MTSYISYILTLMSSGIAVAIQAMIQSRIPVSSFTTQVACVFKVMESSFNHTRLHYHL